MRQYKFGLLSNKMSVVSMQLQELIPAENIDWMMV